MAVHRTVGSGSSIAIASATVTTGSAFDVQSNVVRCVAEGGACHVAIGYTPTAAITDYYIPSGGTANIGMTKASNRVTGITTAANSVVYIDFAEGTNSPFGNGDYISLTVNGQDYYNFTHKRIVDTNVREGQEDSYFQIRITVSHDYINTEGSGIATAFSTGPGGISAWAEATASWKVSNRGVASNSGVLYYQQIQVTGDA